MKQHPFPPRWQQRLSNYANALGQLKAAVLLATERALSDLEKRGLIQAFEVVHELAWNVMKDYFLDQGNPNITGSRDAVREAFHMQLVQDGEQWMEMIKSRNLTVHAYNHEIASDIANKVISVYIHLFESFLLKMQSLIRYD